MAYSSEIAGILADQFTRFATLNRHQLAGHLANLDFWSGEVRHALEVVDGYNPRFETMKASQATYASEHRTVEYLLDDPCCTRTSASPPRRVPSQDLREARRRLCDAFYRFLLRCHHEGLLDEAALRRTCDRLDIGVEAGDLRRRT